jgi:hypothetical protein
MSVRLYFAATRLAISPIIVTPRRMFSTDIRSLFPWIVPSSLLMDIPARARRRGMRGAMISCRASTTGPGDIVFHADHPQCERGRHSDKE